MYEWQGSQSPVYSYMLILFIVMLCIAVLCLFPSPSTAQQPFYESSKRASSDNINRGLTDLVYLLQTSYWNLYTAQVADKNISFLTLNMKICLFPFSLPEHSNLYEMINQMVVLVTLLQLFKTFLRNCPVNLGYRKKKSKRVQHEILDSYTFTI